MQKIFSFILVLFVVTSFSACETSEPTPPNTPKGIMEEQPTGMMMKDTSGGDEFKRYEVESGIITYKLSGAEEGTETLYFKDYGKIEARHKQAKIQLPGGMKLPAGVELPETNQVTLVMGDTVYTYDTVKRTGTKITNTLAMMENLAGQENLRQMGMEMMEKMGAKKTGTKEIAGETCEVYEMTAMNTKTCVWNNLNLETTSNMAGINVSIVAESIETDVNIPEDKITVPSDITFTEMGDFQDMMKKMKP